MLKKQDSTWHVAGPKVEGDGFETEAQIMEGKNWLWKSREVHSPTSVDEHSHEDGTDEEKRPKQHQHSLGVFAILVLGVGWEGRGAHRKRLDVI